MNTMDDRFENPTVPPPPLSPEERDLLEAQIRRTKVDANKASSLSATSTTAPAAMAAPNSDFIIDPRKELKILPVDVAFEIPSGLSASADGTSPVELLQNFTLKVESYCDRGLEALKDKGTATVSGRPSFALTRLIAVPPQRGPRVGNLLADAPDLPPNVPPEARHLIEMVRTATAEDRDLTRNEAIQGLTDTNDWLEDAARQGIADRTFVTNQQRRLTAARGAAAQPGGGGLTTGDIMALIAEVLSKTAQNANEMRFQESQASLSGIQQSLVEAKQAAQKKIESAEEQKEASIDLAHAELWSGFISAAGAIGGLIAGAFPEGAAAAQSINQLGSSIGQIVSAVYKLSAADHQYKSAVLDAAANLLQSYSQQTNTLASRAQSSAQEQGQIAQSVLRSLQELISLINQTTQGIGQSIRS